MLKRSYLCTSGLFCLLVSVPGARAAVIAPLALPGSTTTCCGSYTSATTVFALPGPDGSTFSALSDSTQTITFSTEFLTLSVPGTWAEWSAPPNAESATPTVAWSEGSTSATLSLSQAVGIFGFELEPSDTDTPTHKFTVTFLSGVNSLGSIQLDVAGAGGARLFAGEVVGSANPNLIDSVTISGDGDFAVANIRYAIEAPAGNVPEPRPIFLLGAGGLLLIFGRLLKPGWVSGATR